MFDSAASTHSTFVLGEQFIHCSLGFLVQSSAYSRVESASFARRNRADDRRKASTTTIIMALAAAIAMASSPSASIDIPKLRDMDAQTSFSALPKHGVGLLTPPNSISPNMPAHAAQHLKSPPLLNIVEEDDGEAGKPATPPQESSIDEVLGTSAGAPLSMSALSGLDARATITPALLAKEFLPSIMLGNGPRPIRHVMGELTHTVPGFSRIPPAKARRLVVAALESRNGGGHDGNIAFCKTGWGRWDAHVKGESPDVDKDNHGMVAMDESGDVDMDMDMTENEADKMSMDEDENEEIFSSSSNDDGESDATDDDDWAAVGPQALRKASLPAPGQPAPPRTNYQALGVPISRPSFSSWSRRFSTVSERSMHSGAISSYSPHLGPINTALQTPEEQIAIEALLRMGSV